MPPEEYAAQQALITAVVARFVLQLGRFWVSPSLTVREWLDMLRFLWPEVQRARNESAVLARRFYDSQRSFYLPEFPVNEVELEGSDFETFVQSMEPARKKMSIADSPSNALTMLSLHAVREVENAGRRQIIHAVEEDRDLAEYMRYLEGLADAPVFERAAEAGRLEQEQAAGVPNLRDTRREILEERSGRSKIVRGWARVATGDETCAWCLMLISRGPTYLSAETAGLRDLEDEQAIEMIAAGEDVSSYMDKWHTGCDCKVVPVFKNEAWEQSRMGKAAAYAKDLWDDAVIEARRLRRMEDVPRVHLSGKREGEEFTLNEEAILALRRRLYAGGINPSEFAGFAA